MHVRRWVLAALAVGALLTGCTEPTSAGSSSAAPTGACLRGPVVPWSSEEAQPGRLMVVSDGTAATVGTVDVKGITPGAVNRNRIGDHVYFLSSGDVQHDVTHLIDWLPAQCRVRTVRLEEVVGPLALATDGTDFYTTNTLNFRSHIRRFDAAGALRARRELPDVGVTSLVLDPATQQLYAFANEFHPGGADSYVLIALDAATLTVRSRHELPLATASVNSAVLHGGRLIYPLTNNEATGARGRALAFLDPNTMTAESLDLPAEIPYLLRLAGDTLYVGHTFLNPAFGPISRMRHISRVDLASRAVVGAELSAGIVDFDVDGTRLYLLGAHDDADRFVIETYDTTMTRTESLDVARPTDTGYFYPAGIIAP